VKLTPVWGTQQLANVVVAKELGEPVRTLDQFGRAFESLIQHASFQRSNSSGVFTTFGERSDRRSEARGYICPCKETRDERYPWKPTKCLIVELAVRGTSEHTVSLALSKQELDAVRTRLQLKTYNDLRA
jgi:hypothetical protein